MTVQQRIAFRIQIFLFLIILTVCSNAQPLKDMRGIWIVRHNMKSAADIERFLKIAADNRFTDLFVQVRGRGDAYYQSKYEPMAEGVDPNFDPLSYLLERNKHFNFRIHAWVNVFYFWSSEKQPVAQNHLLHQKPEWIVYPVDYDSLNSDDPLYMDRRNAEGLYHSPLLAEVKDHLLNVIGDIVNNYRVDGIHLDYIRFPGREYDYNPEIRKRFKEKYYLDPIDFQKDTDTFVEKFGRTGYSLFYERWADFLRDGLSECVAAIGNQVHYDHPRIIVSAAVKPDLEMAHWEYYQEWDRWLREGWLDWAIPMNYTPDLSRFTRRMETIAQHCDTSRVLMGIAAYNQPATAVVEKILTVENQPYVGYVLFSYDQLLKDKQLQKLYFKHLSKTEAGK